MPMLTPMRMPTPTPTQTPMQMPTRMPMPTLTQMPMQMLTLTQMPTRMPMLMPTQTLTPMLTPTRMPMQMQMPTRMPTLMPMLTLMPTLTPMLTAISKRSTIMRLSTWISFRPMPAKSQIQPIVLSLAISVALVSGCSTPIQLRVSKFRRITPEMHRSQLVLRRLPALSVAVRPESRFWTRTETGKM